MLPVLLSKALSALIDRPRVVRARGLGFAKATKSVNLALQGGGAHGAFTWGVLDRLLEDGRLAVDSISGASAGAVNAVMLADGLARGGPEEARQRLADFWRASSFGGALPELQREAIERLFAFVPRQSSPVPWLGALSRYWSPYDLNPLNINPLKGLIERFVDFEYPEDLTEYPDLTTAVKKKILGLNAAKLYDIDVPADLRLPESADGPVGAEPAPVA